MSQQDCIFSLVDERLLWVSSRNYTANLADFCFRPRLCEKSCINSQIGVAWKTTPFFLSPSEITVAAPIFSNGISDK